MKDKNGKIIRYLPSHERSKPVRDEIIKKLEKSSKLVVLIGEDTHKSEWVEWEVNTFHKMKEKISGENTCKRIRGMKLKGASQAKIPSSLGGKSAKCMDWNPESLDLWLDEDHVT